MKALQQDRLGRYELLIELARGGMAELFLGRLHGAGGFAKLVAIKRILPHLAQDKQFKEMFLNEGRIAANLSHPNVCQTFELDEVDDELFLAMEYLDGVSWDHLVRELATGNFAMRLAVGVIAQACEGLHYAHLLRDVEGNGIGIVHRDVSPQNLFVTVDGVCKVLDFGVSKMMVDGPRTRSGVIKGKLPYMAPEQIRGEPLDGRADIFALGVCAWEAFTAQRLFDRATDFMIWKAITEEDVPSIKLHWPECPDALDAVVRRALDRDRERRFATAREFADALRSASALPPCSLAEIGDAVRTRCSDRLLERQRQVATAVSSKRGVPDFDSAETLHRPPLSTSMEIRQESVTLDLRRERSRVDESISEAADTRDLGRDAALTRPSEPAIEDREPIRHHRSNVKMTILVAVIAAAVTAAVVVTVMMMNNDREPTQAAPQPQQPIFQINVATPADAAEVAEEAPADAAAPVTTPKKSTTAKKPKESKAGSPDAKKQPSTTSSESDTTEIDAEKIRTDAEKAANDFQKAGEELRDELTKMRDGIKGSK